MKKNKRLSPNEKQCICKKNMMMVNANLFRELEINVKTVISVINLYKTSGGIYAKTTRTTRKKKITIEAKCLL